MWMRLRRRWLVSTPRIESCSVSWMIFWSGMTAWCVRWGQWPWILWSQCQLDVWLWGTRWGQCRDLGYCEVSVSQMCVYEEQDEVSAVTLDTVKSDVCLWGTIWGRCRDFGYCEVSVSQMYVYEEQWRLVPWRDLDNVSRCQPGVCLSFWHRWQWTSIYVIEHWRWMLWFFTTATGLWHGGPWQPHLAAYLRRLGLAPVVTLKYSSLW